MMIDIVARCFLLLCFLIGVQRSQRLILSGSPVNVHGSSDFELNIERELSVLLVRGENFLDCGNSMKIKGTKDFCIWCV